MSVATSAPPAKTRTHTAVYAMARSFGAVGGIATAIVVWELASKAPQFGGSIPSTRDVTWSLGTLMISPAFWSATGHTILAWALGFLIAIVSATAVALMLNSFPLLHVALRPTIEFFRPIPPVTLLPLGLLLYGSTLSMQLLLIIYGCFLPLMTQTMYGLREVDPVARDTFSAYRFIVGRRVQWLSLPSASPFIATGLRVTASLALLVTVTAELLGSVDGLGFILINAQIQGNFPRLYAIVLMTGMLGMLINWVFGALERRFLHWHISQRGVLS